MVSRHEGSWLTMIQPGRAAAFGSRSAPVREMSVPRQRAICRGEPIHLDRKCTSPRSPRSPTALCAPASSAWGFHRVAADIVAARSRAGGVVPMELGGADEAEGEGESEIAPICHINGAGSTPRGKPLPQVNGLRPIGRTDECRPVGGRVVGRPASRAQ